MARGAPTGRRSRLRPSRRWATDAPPARLPARPRCPPSQYDDGQLATDFFGNSTRMWEDLFADVSEQHVGEVYSGF